MRTLDNLSRFVASADAIPIVCFARTQHTISIAFYLSNRVQYFYITIYIAMEELEYLLHLYNESDISVEALDCALRDLNPPAKELTYLLQLYNQEHIGGTAFDYALCDLTSKILKYLLELHEHDRISDEALNSALHVLRPSDKDIGMEEASYKPKQEEEIKEEIKEELYDER